MDLRELILAEHSKTQMLKVVAYVGSNQHLFDELMKLFLASEYRVTQRTAWPVSYIAAAHPTLIKKHLKKIVLNLKNPLHDAVKRNTLRFLQFIELPVNLHGITTAVCFKFLNDMKEPIAVKVFSMTVLWNICKQHPELSNELKLSIEAQLPYGSSGFSSRAKKILKAMN